MPRNPSVLTPEQVKRRLRQRGVTIARWADENGYSRREVYRVLNGVLKAHFGRAHEIAVALGIKGSTSADSDNPQRQRAA